jgi:hypothetical protein
MGLKYEDIVKFKNDLISEGLIEMSGKELDLRIGKMFSISDYTKKLVKRSLVEYGFMEQINDSDRWVVKALQYSDPAKEVDDFTKQVLSGKI